MAKTKKKPKVLTAEDESHHPIKVGSIIDIPARVVKILPGRNGKTDQASTLVEVAIQTDDAAEVMLTLDPSIAFFVEDDDE